ncbi:efflux RND transporter periplasmic adaptor subunit [Cupriavidus sp. CP313]
MRKTSRSWRHAAAGLVAVLTTATLAWYWLAPDKQPRYLTATVERGDIESAVLAIGTLQASKQVDVGAQVTGQIQSLKVELGDKVKKGQWLAQIDPVLPLNELRQKKIHEQDLIARKLATAARLAQADLKLRRQRQMLADDATSRETYETAQTERDVQHAELASLDAQIRTARIQIETAQASLGYTRIVAPIDGEVVAIVTQEGQTVISNQQAPVILKLAELDTMTVKAQISEADVSRVHPGQTAYFTILGEPDKRYYGKLRAIEPAPHNFSDMPSGPSGGVGGGSSKPSTAVFYNALFEVPNPAHRLRIAMTAQVGALLGTARQVLLIPVAALGAKAPDGRHTVRVLGADGKVVTRQVRAGLNNNVKVEVRDGLKSGEQIVIGEAAGTASDPGS